MSFVEEDSFGDSPSDSGSTAMGVGGWRGAEGREGLAGFSSSTAVVSSDSDEGVLDEKHAHLLRRYQPR